MRRGLMPGHLLIPSLILAAAGCGGSQFPETVPVSGKITFDGKPVTTGTVTFQPDEGQAASAMIQPDGSFQLSTFGEKDGAIPGHHRVMIVATDGDPHLMPGSSPGYKPPKDLVPKKYNNVSTSGLSVEVSKDKPTVDLTLH